MREHWEGWIRPLLLVAVGLTVALTGWFGVIPDPVFAWMLLAAAVAVPAGAVVLAALRPNIAAWRRLAVIGLVAAAGGGALYGPWEALGEGHVVAAAELPSSGAGVSIPAPSGGALSVHLDAAVAVGRKKASLALRVHPDDPNATPLLNEVAISGDTHTAEHHVWRLLPAALEGPGRLSIESEGDDNPRWPVSVHVARDVQTPLAPLWPAALLVALAVVLEGSATKVRATRVAYLVASAAGFAYVFPQLWRPDLAARAVLFGLIIGAVGGSLPAAAAVALLRLLRPKRRPTPNEAT